MLNLIIVCMCSSANYGGTDRYDIVLSYGDAARHVDRRRGLSGCYVLHFGGNNVQWILGACHDYHEASCVFQAKGPSFLPCLGLLPTDMDP